MARKIGFILLVLLAVVGGITVSLSTGLILLARHGGTQPPLPQKIVLTLNLNQDWADQAADNPLAQFGPPQPTLLHLVAALDQAAADPRVVALVARTDGRARPLAECQEIRAAIERFTAKGKPAFFYASSFGQGGGATAHYYLASAFSEIWLQYSGELNSTGFALESPFLRDGLNRLGITPQFRSRYEYKSAIEMFTEQRFTAPARSSLDLLLTSWSAQVETGIATARKLKPEDVRAAINRAPLLPIEALDAKLIDKIGYWDDLTTALKPRGTPVTVADYLAHPQPAPKGPVSKVAVIIAGGEVQTADVEGPFGGGSTITAARLEKAFTLVREDPSIKGVLLRINSPGGSYTAADSIWHQVDLTRKAGKPVVASMGAMAASGGYYAAMGADWVVAQPGTITGSIGVFSGKFALTELWNKLGVSWDGVKTADNAGMWSSNTPFSPQALVRLDALLDAIYTDFSLKAARSRGIPTDKIDQLARGRVWSGADAARNGLVNQTGGYDEAFDKLSELLHLPQNAPLDVIEVPPPKSPMEVLQELTQGGSDKGGGFGALFPLLPKLALLSDRLAPLLQDAGQQGLVQAKAAPLEMR